MPIKFFVIAIVLILLAAVIELIRREKLTFKYAVNWFAGCAVTLFFAWNDAWLITLSRFAGFHLPSNFIFFSLLVFVVLLSLGLTLYINEQNSRTEALAQTVARLEQDLKKLKSQAKN